MGQQHQREHFHDLPPRVITLRILWRVQMLDSIRNRPCPDVTGLSSATRITGGALAGASGAMRSTTTGIGSVDTDTNRSAFFNGSISVSFHASANCLPSALASTGTGMRWIANTISSVNMATMPARIFRRGKPSWNASGSMARPERTLRRKSRSPAVADRHRASGNCIAPARSPGTGTGCR